MKSIPIYQNGAVLGYVKAREIADIFSIEGEGILKSEEREPVVIRLKSRWPTGSHFVAYAEDICREFFPKRWRPA